MPKSKGTPTNDQSASYEALREAEREELADSLLDDYMSEL